MNQLKAMTNDAVGSSMLLGDKANQSVADFTLVMHLHEHRTLVVDVSVGDQSVTLYPSFLSDAPRDLADAARILLHPTMAYVPTCRWQDEPGEWRWLLRREANDLQIQIRRFAEPFSSLPDERGESVFQAECSVLRFATQVKGQLHHLLNECGEPGYHSRWGYPFPGQSFRELEAAIQEEKQHRTLPGSAQGARKE